MIEETKNYNSFSYYTQNVREVPFVVNNGVVMSEGLLVVMATIYGGL